MVTASSAIAALSLDLPAAMPIYEYRCENGHAFEVTQRMTDDPVDECTVCGAPVQRVFHPVAVHFKGSGFYNTDYGTKKRARELKDSADKGAAKTEAKAAESKETKKKDKPKDSGSGGDKAKKPA
jgi:putative FmdB family regulatory protein